MRRLGFWFGVTAIEIGCATPRAASPRLLEQRAAFDLGCQPAALTVYVFDERTRAVTGCGQRATYVEDCRAPGRACTWVADVGPAPMTWSVASSNAAPAATAAPTPAWTSAAATPVAPTPVQAAPGPEHRGFREEEDLGF
jgi:hypothetical protein